MTVDRLKPGTRFMRRYTRRALAGALAFSIHEHTWSHYISQSVPVLVRVRNGAGEGAGLLGPDTPAGRRLDETARFFAFMREEIERSMAKWRRLQEAGPEAGRPAG